MLAPAEHLTRPLADPLGGPWPRGIAVRVLVVEDHPAVRGAVRELLEDQLDFEVADAVATAENALRVAALQPVDVALVDYQLGGRDGLWASRKLKRLAHPPRVLIYSAYCNGPLAAACVVAEADGMVRKGGLGGELCDAIRAVARGQLLLPTVPWQLGETMRRRLESEEQAIFGMLSAGFTPAATAATLGLSPPELDDRLSTMLHKLQRLEEPAAPGGALRSRTVL
jgi:two-component system, NarL family, response regulator DevR